MHIQTKIDDKNQLTIKTVNGEASFEETIESFREFYNGATTPNVLWDFRELSLSQITTDHIERIIDYIAQQAQKRANGKSAIVVSKDLEYGISRIVQAMAAIKEIPIEFEIFRTIEEALQWLAGGSDHVY